MSRLKKIVTTSAQSKIRKKTNVTIFVSTLREWPMIRWLAEAGKGFRIPNLHPGVPWKRRAYTSSRAAEPGTQGTLDCQPPFVEAMEVSITHEERAERVRVVYDQVTPGHARSKIPGLLE